MLNLTPEKRRHHLRMRRLDKAGKKASWRFFWRDFKEGWKQGFKEARENSEKPPWVRKLERFTPGRPLWDRKLERFIFPTKAILVEKNRNTTIEMDVFVEFDKHDNIERLIGVDDNIDYTYLLDDKKYGASLVEPRTGHIIANSRIVEPRTGRVLFISWTIRLLKVFMFFIVSEAIFPILWAYHFFKSYEIWAEDESGGIGFLWFSWQFLKLGLYPFLLAYYIIKDCRDIQADTSLGSLVKRLFE